MTDAIPIQIAQKIVEIMQADDSFDDIDMFYIGMPDEFPTEQRQIVMVLVLDETDAQMLTGDLMVPAYRGLIIFDVMTPDRPVPSGRTAIVPSYQAVASYVQACKVLFEPPNHLRLDDLSGDEWAVQQFFIADGGGGGRNVQYGFPIPDERGNNYENTGTVSFVCTVQE